MGIDDEIEYNEDYFDFPTDKCNIFFIGLDSSDSMKEYKTAMCEGLQLYKSNLVKFSESKSIAVSICRFDSDFYPSPFRPVSEMDISYHTGGSTALYYSICKAGEKFINYYKKVAKKKKVMPRGTFIWSSDGEPCDDPGNVEDAKEIIQQLNDLKITTGFIAFGKAISSKFGENLGFKATIDVNNMSILKDFMGETLSKSCKEQSRSAISLDSAFFSKATADASKSAQYSQKTEQATEDDSWFSRI